MEKYGSAQSKTRNYLMEFGSHISFTQEVMVFGAGLSAGTGLLPLHRTISGMERDLSDVKESNRRW
jgi:hypothetical protein